MTNNNAKRTDFMKRLVFHKQVSFVITLSNRKGAGGFSKRRREGKRAANDDDDGEQKGR